MEYTVFPSAHFRESEKTGAMGRAPMFPQAVWGSLC